MIGGRGGGDFERTTLESELVRPIMFWILHSGIKIAKLLTFSIYEAFLIGSWHCVIAIMVSVISILKFEDGKVAIKYSMENDLCNYNIVAGLFSFFMLIMGTGIWPWYTIGDGKLWIAFDTFSFALGAFFIWLRFILIVIPLLVLEPTNILEWVAKIESIFPRFRSTPFTTADSVYIDTPLGKVGRQASQLADGIYVDAYANNNLPAATNYIVADSQQKQDKIDI